MKHTEETFKYNLKLLRASSGLSGKELSIELDMSVKRINDLEEGRMPPNLEDLIKIVGYFKISFDDLLMTRIQLKLYTDDQKLSY